MEYDGADGLDATVRRFDTIVSSPELGVHHLEWKLRSPDDMDEVGTVNEDGSWVNENIFPGINARFLTERGRRAFGTTVNVEMW